MSWSIRIRGELYNFPDKATVTIGRSEDSDLKIQSRSVDHRHAVLGYDNDKKMPFVKDLGSKNGTHLNELRISANENTYIAVRDIIKIGYDNNVLRIEEVPKYSGQQRIPKSQTTSTVSMNTDDITKEPMFQQKPKEPPVIAPLTTQEAPGPIQYITLPHMQASPQHTGMLPSTHAVSYVPMTYYVPVTAAGMGIPVNPQVLPSATSMQPLTVSPQLPVQTPLLPDIHVPQPAHHPTSTVIHTANTQPFFQHVQQSGLKKDVTNASVVGELTMALLDLESDGDVNLVTTGHHKMPTLDSDVSSTFTSVSKQLDTKATKSAPARTGSLKREDGRRQINVSESRTLSHGSKLYGNPEWWVDKTEDGRESRSRSSSTNSDDFLESRKPHKHQTKKGFRKPLNAQNDVRSTDEGFAAEDEESDSNVELSHALKQDIPTTTVSSVLQQEHQPPTSVDPEKPELPAFDEPPQPDGPPVDDLVPSESNTTVILPSTENREEGQSSCSVDESEVPPSLGTTWTIQFDDDPKPKSRRSMPNLTTSTKRSGAKAESNRPRKSYSPAWNKTVSKTPKTVTPGKSSPLSQTTVKSKSSSTGKTKTTGKPAAAGERSSSPFLRNTAQRRTFTKKDGASTPEIPVISKEKDSPVLKSTHKAVKTQKPSPKGKRGAVSDKVGGRNRPVSQTQKKQTTPKLSVAHKYQESKSKPSEQTALVDEPPKPASTLQKTFNPTVDSNTKRPTTDHDSHPQPYFDDSLESTKVLGLEMRKVVGEEAVNQATVSVHSEEVGVAGTTVTTTDRRGSVPASVDSVIVAANFGDDLKEGSLQDTALVDLHLRENIQTPNTVGRLHRGEGASYQETQTPKNFTPLSVGPATSSPKDLHTGRVHPESLTPMPIQLDTNSSGLADQPDVNSTSKPRVGSARRQWNQSQSVVVDGLVLAHMEGLSKHISTLAGGSLGRLVNLKTVMEKEGLMTSEDPCTDAVSEEGERYDQLAMWKSLPKEFSELFQFLKETEKRLAEIDHTVELMSRKMQLPGSSVSSDRDTHHS